MTTTNDPFPTLDVFVDKIRHLSPEERKYLLEKLDDVEDTASPPENSINDVYGAWDFDESPEETVRKIREARQFNRTRDSL